MEDRRYNIARLRKEALAKMDHADALEAETDELLAEGKLAEITPVHLLGIGSMAEED